MGLMVGTAISTVPDINFQLKVCVNDLPKEMDLNQYFSQFKPKQKGGRL